MIKNDGKQVGPGTKAELDFNISASASLLPPLAGGGKT